MPSYTLFFYCGISPLYCFSGSRCRLLFQKMKTLNQRFGNRLVFVFPLIRSAYCTVFLEPDLLLLEAEEPFFLFAAKAITLSGDGTVCHVGYYFCCLDGRLLLSNGCLNGATGRLSFPPFFGAVVFACGSSRSGGTRQFGPVPIKSVRPAIFSPFTTSR